MELKEVLEGVDYKSEKSLDSIYIKDISYNSSKASKDTIFVALVGKTVDGHKYIEDAYDRGCRIFLVSQEVERKVDSIYIEVDNTRKVLSRMSANFFRHPSKSLKLIGITGTKGKTTTSNYLRTVLEDRGYTTGIIGTNGVFYKDRIEDTDNTTPESYEIQRIFRSMLGSGVSHVVMEVSSGGIMMNRVDDVDFDIGVFTNISEDHIGPKEHPNFDHYFHSKMGLFKRCKKALVNLDDKHIDQLIENISRDDLEIYSFAIDRQADFKASNINLSKDLDHLGVKFDLFYRASLIDEFILAAPGKFSVYNALAVIGVSNLLDIDFGLVKESLGQAKVDGRVEVLSSKENYKIILDYAHNKDSLDKVLDTLRLYKPKRLICLIGSVGGRSQLRRYEIGEVISQKCDLCVLTEDNPNYENPLDIIEDIKKGYKKDVKTLIEPDRTLAIQKAIDLLEDGDILLLAGRGHEEYQLKNGKKVRHCDRTVALEYLV